MQDAPPQQSEPNRPLWWHLARWVAFTTCVVVVLAECIIAIGVVQNIARHPGARDLASSNFSVVFDMRHAIAWWSAVAVIVVASSEAALVLLRWRGVLQGWRRLLLIVVGTGVVVYLVSLGIQVITHLRNWDNSRVTVRDVELLITYLALVLVPLAGFGYLLGWWLKPRFRDMFLAVVVVLAVGATLSWGGAATHSPDPTFWQVRAAARQTPSTLSEAECVPTLRCFYGGTAGGTLGLEQFGVVGNITPAVPQQRIATIPAASSMETLTCASTQQCSVLGESVNQQRVTMYHSKDGGRTWAEQAIGRFTVDRVSCAAQSCLAIVASLDRVEVFGSDNGGTSWEYRSSLNDQGFNSSTSTLECFSPGACFATDALAGTENVAAETNDGGRSWKRVQVPKGYLIIQSQCSNLLECTLVAVSSGYTLGGSVNVRLWTTTDGGTSWSTFTKTTANVGNEPLACTGPLRCWLAVGSTILHTTNGWLTSTTTNLTTRIRILGLSCASTAVCAAVGTQSNQTAATTSALVLTTSGWLKSQSRQPPKVPTPRRALVHAPPE